MSDLELRKAIRVLERYRDQLSSDQKKLLVALVYPAPDGRWVCLRCGSDDVQTLDWINPNTNELVGGGEELWDNRANSFCNHCEDNVGVEFASNASLDDLCGFCRHPRRRHDPNPDRDSSDGCRVRDCICGAFRE